MKRRYQKVPTFLSVFLLCILVTGYYDQAYDSTACPRYGYFNLNDDSNDLDLQKQRIRHSNPGINCIVLYDVQEGITYRILLEKPFYVTIVGGYKLRSYGRSMNQSENSKVT
jgi:hypothetical protein